MQPEGKSRKLLRLHGDDNVLIVVSPVRPGDRLTIGWEEKTAGEIGFTCSTGSPERRVLVGTLRMRTR